MIEQYPLLPSPVVSICDLQRLALYWFHAPGLQRTIHVAPSATSTMVTGPVRKCLQVETEHTCSRPPGAIKTSSWLWHCLLTYLQKQHLNFYKNLNFKMST